MKALTADTVLDFQKPRQRRPQYLALENGEFVYLDDRHILAGTPLPYNYVITGPDGEAHIVLTQDSITAADGWHAELDADGKISLNKAAEIADSINETTGISLAMAIQRAHELAAVAERAAAEAQAAALARASAVARVVNLSGGNQSQAARALGIDQSRVSRLVAKAGTLKTAVQEMSTSAASAHDAMLLMQSALQAPDVD